MEAEAETDTHLGVSIQQRRRTHSVSDDYNVQKTNDDATESKICAIKRGYWQDKFIDSFTHYSPDSAHHHRDPEISRGYWARVAAVSSIVTQFVNAAGSLGAQVVSLGAGFDTLYWRLRDSGITFRRYVELDFSSVTSKKIRLIRRVGKSPANDLTSYFSGPVSESQHSELHAGDYHLLGADLRQIQEFRERLQSAELDPSLPTLFIAECVLIYMDNSQCSTLLKEISDTFSSICFINYEQVNMTDAFSQVMTKNLEQRGILLPGAMHCQSLESQKHEFLEAGWKNVDAWTMEEIYQKFLNRSEIERIERLEPLDEKELLSQLLLHYCLVYASKGVGDQFSSIRVQ